MGQRAGAPARTQDVVRRIIDENFDDTPAGLPGNDDLGAMSSWLVWASLGMFPPVPGHDSRLLDAAVSSQSAKDVPAEPADIDHEQDNQQEKEVACPQKRDVRAPGNANQFELRQRSEESQERPV